MSDERKQYPPNTLGYHRMFVVALFGEDSKALTFLDKKIAESPNGADEEVMIAESQMVYLLGQIHLGLAEG